jgi:drug/metabolite transporter (DMT)-like permease
LKGETLRNLFYLFLSVFLGVSGQFLIKHGLYRVGSIEGTIPEMLRSIAFAMRNPFILMGFISYFMSASSWLILLSRVELSYAYPMVSLGYVFVVIASRFILGEAVTLSRLLGTIVICAGVILVARS